ncbi:MAG: hypothetical protein KDJ65_01040 [Anaerolineae bacterium]|nr:hypothetical protein [Anaerolineae bacterium]
MTSLVDFLMTSQWKGVLFWVSAIVIIILATVFYQPAAAKTGSLLVWTRDRVYIMDIDTLNLERVGPATAQETITPSPGCSEQTTVPCWVVVSDRIYKVDIGTDQIEQTRLPVDDGYRWINSAVSWSPDGLHIAYSVQNNESSEAELRIYDASSRQVKIKAANVDPAVAVAWTSDCAAGLEASNCEIGYKQLPNRGEQEVFPWLVGFNPATESVQKWALSPEEIFELNWTAQNTLLYSRPKRFFRSSEDHTEAYHIPPGSQLANMSPDGRYTVYYQPFKLKDCPPDDPEGDCVQLGVWLTSNEEIDPEKKLIYNTALSVQNEGLNFIPIWSLNGDEFVFFLEGKLIYYNLLEEETTIWYRSINGKLRSIPVFSPNEEAVAFVDDQGQGYSEYRLVIANPKLQPVEHIIETDSGFKILAWLPN